MIGFIIGICAVPALVLAVVLVELIVQGGVMNNGVPPPMVKPVPIAAIACPYVRTVRTSADRAGSGSTDQLLGLNHPAAWRPFAAQPAPKLATTARDYDIGVVMSGYTALSHASDLVGAACGPPLAPSI